MKKVEGYDYAVSQSGKLYNLSESEIQGSKDRKGYIHVSLSKDGVRKTFLLHRLVASAYIENPNNYPQVNHIDGNKSNNSVDNLEWATASSNVIHAYNTGLSDYSGERNGRAKYSDIFISTIRKDFEEGLTRKQLSALYSISYSHIVSILSNKRR